MDYYARFLETPENCGPRRIPNIDEFAEFLLSMCDVIPLSNVRYLYGPKSYAEFTDGTRTIGVFGESHDIPVPNPAIINKSNTISVPSLIKIVINTFPNKFYDLFLEFDYTKDQSVKRDGIPYFNYIFEPCMRIANKECPFNNIRVHYTDYRFLIRNNPVYERFMDNYFDGTINWYFNLGNLYDVFGQLYPIVTTFLESDPKVKLSESPLKNFIKRKIEQLKNSVDQPFFPTDRQSEVDMIETRIQQIMELYAIVMDVYTLKRVFKTFDVSKSTHPPIAKNSIIYAGEAHAQNYREFLTESGFIQTHYISNMDNDSYLLDFSEIRKTSFLFA